MVSPAERLWPADPSPANGPEETQVWPSDPYIPIVRYLGVMHGSWRELTLLKLPFSLVDRVISAEMFWDTDSGTRS